MAILLGSVTEKENMCHRLGIACSDQSTPLGKSCILNEPRS
jgi:hypothetical protein